MTVDERALEAAMDDEMFPKSRALISKELRRLDRGSLDENAFEAACDAYGNDDDPRIEKTIRQRICAAIEAYEAARWRPIEEYQGLAIGTDVDVWAPNYKNRERNPWRDEVSLGGKEFWIKAKDLYADFATECYFAFADLVQAKQFRGADMVETGIAQICRRWWER